jgi:hypothetical protein
LIRLLAPARRVSRRSSLAVAGWRSNSTRNTPLSFPRGSRPGANRMAVDSRITARIEEISAAETWNRRISLIRQIPEEFGKARHQEVYAAVAQAVYVAELAPDFAYIHWRDEYELPAIERAYAKAFTLTQGFTKTDADELEAAIVAEPETLRIFRLFLGFTTQEFATSSTIVASELGSKPLSNGLVKSMEAGRPALPRKSRRRSLTRPCGANYSRRGRVMSAARSPSPTPQTDGRRSVGTRPRTCRSRSFCTNAITGAPSASYWTRPPASAAICWKMRLRSSSACGASGSYGPARTQGPGPDRRQVRSDGGSGSRFRCSRRGRVFESNP